MAEHDATPPADGYYWLQATPESEPEVCRLLDGELLLTGTGFQRRFELFVRDGGRLLGRIPEPGQQPAAYMSPDGTRTMPAVIFDAWKARRPDDAGGWVALAPMAAADLSGTPWPATTGGPLLGAVLAKDRTPIAELQPVPMDTETMLRGPIMLITSGSINHADLLRRYVALVVAAEGFDFLGRVGDGPTAGITFTPEELAHLKALSAAASDGSAS